MTSAPWLIHFFESTDGSVPAIQFLDAVPTAVVAEFEAILDAVAEAPPPAFSGGGKWEVMHGENEWVLRGSCSTQRNQLSPLLRPGAGCN